MVMPERPPVRRQCPRRQVGLVDQARQQPAPGLACKQWAAVPGDLAGNLPVPRALPLTNPHCTSHRNLKPLRRPPNGCLFLHCRRDPRPDIHGQWQHDALAHHLLEKVNRKTLASGIHIPIQPDADLL